MKALRFASISYFASAQIMSCNRRKFPRAASRGHEREGCGVYERYSVGPGRWTTARQAPSRGCQRRRKARPFGGWAQSSTRFFGLFGPRVAWRRRIVLNPKTRAASRRLFRSTNTNRRTADARDGSTPKVTGLYSATQPQNAAAPCHTALRHPASRAGAPLGLGALRQLWGVSRAVFSRCVGGAASELWG